MYLYMSGAADSATERGEGAKFCLSKNSSGTVSLDWQYLDYVYMAGGVCRYRNAELEDNVSFKLYAPATDVTANAGAGAVNLTDIGGGINMIVPDQQTDGSHDLGTTKVPVPNESGTGWWDWSDPSTGLGTVTANYDQTGAYDLFDTQLDLFRFANYICMMGSGVLELDIEEIKPKKMLPQWKWKVTLEHGGGNNTVEIAWHLVLGRAKTL
jgi:hypothetical protein